jgi:D-alanyl-lipoteichoic acid acyltransferase DltB (MBOAT superfamily)
LIAGWYQIYGDFSGYSDIAIGCARLFGIELKRNFNFPYFSRDIAEFWRRWHISLTTWFRDYIYIPLGGSRAGKWKSFRNTMVIFLVSGFWHGANWTFIVWGAYHALLFLPLLLLGKNRKYTNTVAAGRLLPSFKEIIQMLSTFFFVIVGWILFRAENITQAWDYLCRIFSPSLFTFPDSGRMALIYSLVLIAVEWAQRNKQHALQIDNVKYRAVRWGIYSFIALYTITNAGGQAEFIYFQF